MIVSKKRFWCSSLRQPSLVPESGLGTEGIHSCEARTDGYGGDIQWVFDESLRCTTAEIPKMVALGV